MRIDPIDNDWWWQFIFTDRTGKWCVYIQDDSLCLAEKKFKQRFPSSRRCFTVSRASRPAEQIIALGSIHEALT